MRQEALGEERDPEIIRTNIMEVLGRHEITPVGPGVPKLVRYHPDYFEFWHECHNMGDRLMRIAGNEVYVEGGRGLRAGDRELASGFHRLDSLEEEAPWETISGRFTALLYDPRWLINRLQDLSLDQEGVHTVLKGSIDPVEQDIMPTLSSPKGFVGDKEEEIIQGIVEQQEVIFETLSPEERAAKFTEYQQLGLDELKMRVYKDIFSAWQFRITLDDRSLPIFVRLPKYASKMLEDLPEVSAAEGVSFQYRTKAQI